MNRIDVAILGSTGSIGTQALEVVSTHEHRFNVVALSAAGGRPDALARQVRHFKPKVVGVATDRFSSDSDELRLIKGAADAVGAEIVVGAEASATLAGMFPDATVLNGINGAVGLTSTLAALEAGSVLALANKESLVVGGAVVKAAVQYPGQVVPVDSEHSAIAQALLAGHHEKGMVSKVVTGRSDLESLVLTASGGPFRGMKRNQLQDVTAEQALAHPTWSMGPVVTVNSSTLMNKGLELIEASLLFDVPPTQIHPVIHPQSVVHSMVTWKDGSTIAQASYPDMKVPIALGMDWNWHHKGVGSPLRWDSPTEWTFEPVDNDTFPALAMAQHCLEQSGTHPAVYNGANEIAVDAFLKGRLGWLQIMDTVAKVVGEHEGVQNPSLEDILLAQDWAFERARQIVAGVTD